MLFEFRRVVLERICNCIVNVLLLFCNYFPLKKGVALYMNLNPFPRRCFVPNLVEIGSVILEIQKKMKMRKVYRRTDGQMTGDQNNSLEL